jgi:methylamine dehydrogenase accessory protein MauD
VSLLIASQVLLWVLVAALAFTVLALARQIGVLHERIAPVGALVMDSGPAVGTPAPFLIGRLLDGESYSLGGGRPVGGRILLLMFVSSDCPICKRLIPIARAMARDELCDLVFVGDADPAVQRALVKRFDLGRFPFINGPEVGMAFQIGKLPYAVLIDEAGLIAAKGLVNSREHLESLITAKQLGVGSIQEFLRARDGQREVEAV